MGNEFRGADMGDCHTDGEADQQADDIRRFEPGQPPEVVCAKLWRIGKAQASLGKGERNDEPADDKEKLHADIAAAEQGQQGVGIDICRIFSGDKGVKVATDDGKYCHETEPVYDGDELAGSGFTADTV